MPYMFIWILSALYIYEFLWNVHIYIFIQAYMAIQDLRVPIFLANLMNVHKKCAAALIKQSLLGQAQRTLCDCVQFATYSICHFCQMNLQTPFFHGQIHTHHHWQWCHYLPFSFKKEHQLDFPASESKLRTKHIGFIRK